MDISLIYLLISFMALLFSAFYSGCETGFISLSRIKLRYMSMQGNNRAREIEKLHEKPENYLSIVLIGTNIMNILFTSFFTLYLNQYFKEWAIILISTTIVLIGGEIIPKSLYREFPQFLAFKSLPAVRYSYYLFYPLIYITTGFTKMINKILRIDSTPSDYFYSRQGIRGLINEGTTTGAVEPEELEIITRVFNFRDETVGNVKTDKSNIVSVVHDTPIEEVKNIIEKSGRSRIPVYEGQKKNIIGIIHAYDILTADDPNVTIKDIIKPVYFVYADKSCNHMLKEFQNLKSQIAIVISRNDELLGLVSLEDILENLVGDIKDEHDKGAGV